MNLTSNVNLMRLKMAAVTTINGKECLVLPIAENDLYCTRDESGKPKGVFLGLNHWENRQPSRYGDTHSIKQNHSKEFREAMTEEQRRAESYLGHSKPLGQAQPTTAAAAPQQPAEKPIDVNWNGGTEDLFK